MDWDFPVVFTRGLFDPGNSVLWDAIDRLGENDGIGRWSSLTRMSPRPTRASGARAAYFAAHHERLNCSPIRRSLPGGESVKNDLSLVEGFMSLMLAKHLDRQAFAIIVGGGAVLDAVGLAAALVHRGVRQVRVPTTVLAQNDAGVGVKNGVNFLGGKNAIGTFAPPFAVLNDFDFLLTLPDREWLCGVAEAFKVSIIRDRSFLDELVAKADRYPARDFEAMQSLVIRCAEIHLEHIRTNGDPFEYGRARPLDFGHWSAHKLELLSGFRISHGEAVAAGVMLDSIYARLQRWLSDEEFALIRDGFIRSGFRLWFPELDARDAAGQREIFGGLRDFQEHLGGELTVTFPRGLGARHEVHEIDLAMMENAIQELEALFRER